MSAIITLNLKLRRNKAISRGKWLVSIKIPNLLTTIWRPWLTFAAWLRSWVSDVDIIIPSLTSQHSDKRWLLENSMNEENTCVLETCELWQKQTSKPIAKQAQKAPCLSVRDLSYSVPELRRKWRGPEKIPLYVLFFLSMEILSL